MTLKTETTRTYTLICDRCKEKQVARNTEGGAKLLLGDGWRDLSLQAMDMVGHTKVDHLCPRCVTSFSQWFLFRG